MVLVLYKRVVNSRCWTVISSGRSELEKELVRYALVLSARYDWVQKKPFISFYQSVLRSAMEYTIVVRGFQSVNILLIIKFQGLTPR